MKAEAAINHSGSSWPFSAKGGCRPRTLGFAVPKAHRSARLAGLAVKKFTTHSCSTSLLSMFIGEFVSCSEITTLVSS